jgi:hypothetical protein
MPGNIARVTPLKSAAIVARVSRASQKRYFAAGRERMRFKKGEFANNSPALIAGSGRQHRKRPPGPSVRPPAARIKRLAGPKRVGPPEFALLPALPVKRRYP